MLTHLRANCRLTAAICLSSAFQCGVKALKILRWQGGEIHVRATDRMDKPQRLSVQRLSAEVARFRRSRDVRRQFPASSIDRIADQGMADMAHMHPDLMCAPSFQPALHQSGMGNKRLPHRNPRHRVPSALKQNGLPLTVGLVARELRSDFQHTGFETNALDALQTRIALVWHTVANRQIAATGRMRGELRGQPMMRGVGFRNDEQAGCALVDPVHDTRALLPTDARQIAAEMVQERVDQSAARRTRGRVHDHASRFVDDDQVGIFVDDGQRDIFRDGFNLSGLFHRDLEHFAFCHLAARVRDLRACRRYSSILQQSRQPRPAEMRRLWHITGQRLIKARRRVGADGDKDNAGHGR